MVGLIFSFLVTLNISLLLPITLLILIVQRIKVSWIPIVMGGITFIVMQFVQLPILQWIAGIEQLGSRLFDQLLPALLLGFFVGIFVEISRLVVLKYFKKWDNAFFVCLAFGLGYYAFESVLLVGLPVLSNFVNMIKLRVSGPNNLPFTSEIITKIYALWDLPWYTPLLSSVERLSTLILHCSLAIIIFQFIDKKKNFWVVLAIVWHAIFEGSLVLLPETETSFWITLIILSVFSVINLVLLYRLNFKKFFDLKHQSVFQQELSGGVKNG